MIIKSPATIAERVSIVEPNEIRSAPTAGSPPPSTSWKIAGMTSATAASSSIDVWTLAAVLLKVWRSRPSPPTNIEAPRTSRMLPRIDPISDALTTSCSP